MQILFQIFSREKGWNDFPLSMGPLARIPKERSVNVEFFSEGNVKKN